MAVLAQCLPFKAIHLPPGTAATLNGLQEQNDRHKKAKSSQYRGNAVDEYDHFSLLTIGDFILTIRGCYLV